MFTGIIEAVGRVRSISVGAESAKVELYAELLDNDIKVGDSVAVNGVCLTVTSKDGNIFCADVGNETLKVTTLGFLKGGSYVNIERPVKLGGRLDGHLVQGHVDGIGKVLNINKISTGVEVTLEVDNSLSKYLVKRGSVAVNGISLTITAEGPTSFKVFLIPHTVESTTFKYAKVGDLANLEVDIIGKYIEKMTRVGDEGRRGASRIDEEFLKMHGF